VTRYYERRSSYDMLRPIFQAYSPRCVEVVFANFRLQSP
jgi:hypothetical protein